jgi:hypothetical protein
MSDTRRDGTLTTCVTCGQTWDGDAVGCSCPAVVIPFENGDAMLRDATERRSALVHATMRLSAALEPISVAVRDMAFSFENFRKAIDRLEDGALFPEFAMTPPHPCPWLRALVWPRGPRLPHRIGPRGARKLRRRP